MSLSRREVLLGGLTLGAAAACGTSPAPSAEQRPQTAPPAEPSRAPHGGDLDPLRSTSGNGNPVVSIEGMIACVFPTFTSGRAVTQLALDCAVMDVSGQIATLPYHAPSLMLPRVLLMEVEAPPTAVDDYYAYWSLVGTRVEVKTGSKTAFITNSEVPTKQNEPQNTKEWASTWWMHSLNEMYGVEGPVKDWRNQTFVSSVVRFSAGATVEPPYTAASIGELPDFEKPQGEFDFVKYSNESTKHALLTQRTYKHAVRVELDATAPITFEIQSQRGGKPQAIRLKPASETKTAKPVDRIIRLSNYPAIWRDRKIGEPQRDTVVYGALCRVDVGNRYVPVLRKDPSVERVNGCDCCLGPKLNEPVERASLAALW